MFILCLLGSRQSCIVGITMNKRERNNFQALMKVIACVTQGPSKKQMTHSKGVIQEILMNKDTKKWAGSRKTNYGKTYLGRQDCKVTSIHVGSSDVT